ncbi:NUMOD4 motif-containing HNH endonuclease [Paraburkholderia sediminicola]|uniref:NUMOD4 motif-containing HNH endonuclease n=1 Tax=Paraburkholderia sediminicola TaxID=458836 RepID=UPI0038B97044
MDDIEEWRDVTGYEGIYQASNMGRVRRLQKGEPSKEALSPGYNSKGYPHVTLSVGGVKRTIDVHTLVLMAFSGPRPPGMEACHYPDNDPANNRLSNLRWGTHTANMMDARLLMAKTGRVFGRPPILPWDAVKAIRASDERPADLAIQYGVKPSLINNIRWGKARTQSAGSILARMAVMA